jgi:PAS domain S-box-containing protein
MTGNGARNGRRAPAKAARRPEALGLLTSVGQVPADRLRTIFDGMFDGVWLVSGDATTTYANEAMATLLGTSSDAMRGLRITEFLAADQWDDVLAFLARQREQAGERMEICFRRVDGGDLFGVVAGSPITTNEDVFVGTMLNVSDVTGKRSIDAQVVQSQRLEAVGQFAGGIAHDFNNLLTAIHGYTTMAIDSLPADDPMRHDLGQVIESSERATAITRQLLAFTRRQVLMPVDVDPEVVVGGLLPILAPLLGETVITMDVAPNHAWVRVDPTQLEQVVMNLTLNARDAMPSGGTVTISIHDLDGPDPERPDPDLTDGPFVRISVADTGIGMDEATRARIFDPFYTTKGVGHGTGFGLSTVFGIVAQSTGHVQVESAPGKGSTFHVDLPRVPRRPVAATPTPIERIQHGTGTILLAEDDPAVRLFARRSLESAGYTVFAAAGAREAIEASAHWTSTIEVLVSDMVMPGMHGHELAQLIRKSRPGIGIVLMSGYTDHYLIGAELGEVEFLNKPFTAAALSGAVDRVMPITPGIRVSG